MTYFLLTIFSLLFIYLTWRKPIWAIAFIILGLPTYQIRFQLLGVPYTLLEVMIWLAFLVMFIKWFGRRQKLKDKKIPYKSFPFQWLCLFWIVAATLAMALSPNLRAALGLWKAYFIEPVMFFILFIAHIKTKKDLYFIFHFLGLSALVVSALAIHQKFTGWMIPNPFWQAEETRRVTSVFGYPNAIGLYLAPIIMLYFGWLWTETKKLWPTVYKIAVILCSTLAVLWAVSEGALFGLATGLIVFLLFYNKKSRLALTVILGIVIICLAINQPLTEQINEKILMQDFSGKIRTSMWSETWEMLKDNPITGAGLAGYQQTIEPYHNYNIWIGKTMQPVEIYLFPHNIFLNFWSELGLLGLVVFILIVGKYFYIVIRLWWQNKGAGSRVSTTIPLSLLCLMLVIIVHGLVDAPYLKNDLAVMFWLFIGIITTITLNKNLLIKKEP